MNTKTIIALTIAAIASSDGAKFIPYYAWDNREAGRMKVWFDLK